MCSDAAIDLAAAAAAMLGKGRPRVAAGKIPSPRALLWAQAQTQLGAAYHTTIRHEEAAAAYARALGVLEAAPRGTRDASGRPLEMEILAVKMERYAPPPPPPPPPDNAAVGPRGGGGGW